MRVPPIDLSPTQQITLACAVVSWDGILTLLRGLHNLGCEVPEGMANDASDELVNHTLYWSAYHDQEWTTEETVDHATEWLISHQVELEKILRERSEASGDR